MICFFLLYLLPCISLSCLLFLVRTSSRMWNRRWERINSCFVSDFLERFYVYILFLLIYKFFSFPRLLRGFIFFIMGRFWILSNTFACAIWDHKIIFTLNLLILWKGCSWGRWEEARAAILFIYLFLKKGREGER